MSQAGQIVSLTGSLIGTLTGNSGGAVGPDGSTNINIVGSGGVVVAGDPGTHTLTISISGGGLTWNVITTSSAALVAGNGYIANYVSTCVLTLPSTVSSTVGDTIKVTGINNPNGWKIAQNASQTIFFSTALTTTGVAGYLASTQVTDSVEMVYVATNEWQVVSSVGNVTYF